MFIVCDYIFLAKGNWQKDAHKMLVKLTVDALGNPLASLGLILTSFTFLFFDLLILYLPVFLEWPFSKTFSALYLTMYTTHIPILLTMMCFPIDRVEKDV